MIIDGSECGQDRQEFGCAAVSQKLRRIQYYKIINISDQTYIMLIMFYNVYRFKTIIFIILKVLKSFNKNVLVVVLPWLATINDGDPE